MDVLLGSRRTGKEEFAKLSLDRFDTIRRWIGDLYSIFGFVLGAEQYHVLPALFVRFGFLAR